MTDLINITHPIKRIVRVKAGKNVNKSGKCLSEYFLYKLLYGLILVKRDCSQSHRSCVGGRWRTT